MQQSFYRHNASSSQNVRVQMYVRMINLSGKVSAEYFKRQKDNDNIHRDEQTCPVLLNTKLEVLHYKLCAVVYCLTITFVLCNVNGIMFT